MFTRLEVKVEERKLRLQKFSYYFVAAASGMLIAWGLDALLERDDGGTTRASPTAPVPLPSPEQGNPPSQSLDPPTRTAPEAASGNAELPPPGPGGEDPPALKPVAPAGKRSTPTGFLDQPPTGEKLRFQEIWAYLMSGEEKLWSRAAPLTDIALFDFSLDAIGRLHGNVDTRALTRARGQGIRTHLVIASAGNQSLLHLALSPAYGVRKALLASIAALPRKYPVDGVQLDLESPRVEEREDLLSFIRELRAALPPGILLSLAIPARTSDLKRAYRYADLAGLADRLFIMVYDQHWKGGSPGPISNLDWHNRVLDYTRSRLPQEQVVVGLPFYGRVWQREPIARALPYPDVRELAGKTRSVVRRDPAQSNSFTYRSEVTAECWFEDVASLRAKMESGRMRGFTRIGFWRLGQEDPLVWEILEREKARER